VLVHGLSVFADPEGVPVIPAEYTERWYEMDYETEILLNDSTGLKEGMVVLSELDGLRTDLTGWMAFNPDRPIPLGILAQANRWNRWSRIVTINRLAGLFFMAVEYADGSRRQLSGMDTQAWYVKKDSIPEEV
jgi:hypothetical protein